MQIAEAYQHSFNLFCVISGRGEQYVGSFLRPSESYINYS
jgi:hypothetical protein